MKRHWLLTALGAILAGAGLHFLWQALPNPLFALISPVNESVWEHLKLLYWPMLAAALVLARGPRRIAVWAGFFPAIVLQPVFLLALYYGLRALGVQGLAVDLTLYVLTMAGGFLLAARLSRSGLPLYGTALRQDTVDVRAVDYSRCALAIGSEGKGLSQQMLELCDRTVRIPMSPHCESLNAAAAAAVVLWEAARMD